MHLFRNTIVAYAIFINLVALFEIFVAHDIVVASQRLNYLGFAIVVHYDRLWKVAPSTDRNSRRNRVYRVLGNFFSLKSAFKEQGRAVIKRLAIILLNN